LSHELDCGVGERLDGSFSSKELIKGHEYK
jgi:hypothetical protein